MSSFFVGSVTTTYPYSIKNLENIDEWTNWQQPNIQQDLLASENVSGLMQECTRGRNVPGMRSGCSSSFFFLLMPALGNIYKSMESWTIYGWLVECGVLRGVCCRRGITTLKGIREKGSSSDSAFLMEKTPWIQLETRGLSHHRAWPMCFVYKVKGKWNDWSFFLCCKTSCTRAW